MLASGKPDALQGGQGRLCGMGQGQAHPGLHGLFPALLGARRALGDAPARSLTALAPRRGVSATAGASVVAPLAEASAARDLVAAAAPASPLGPRTGPHGASSAPRPLRYRRRVRAGRQRRTRSKMACWSRPASPSSCCATPTAAVGMPCASPRRHRLPCRPGARACRRAAARPARSRRGRAACPRSNPAARSAPSRSNRRTRRGPSGGGGSSTSTAGSSAAGA